MLEFVVDTSIDATINGKYEMRREERGKVVKIKPVDVKIKLGPGVTMPKKAHEDDAAFDICANLLSPVKIPPHCTAKIPTGIYTEIPSGYVGHIWARSGLSTKEGLRPANCVAVIDSIYRGEWMVPIHNDCDVERVIENGQRIAQITIDPVIPVNFIQTEELEESDRGTTGFGDSGKF